jgi:hypothetical protein
MAASEALLAYFSSLFPGLSHAILQQLVVVFERVFFSVPSASILFLGTNAQVFG